MLGRGFWVAVQAAVSRGGLNNRATRGNQPVEALGKRHPAKAASLALTRADQIDQVQLFTHDLKINVRGQSQQTSLVQMRENPQKSSLATKEDDTYIDAL